ncbi:hypothetical protein GCM10010264_16600 [Streptomyces globisporus]|uniref:hypothetical protein n=1 Tax=Streptomyces globisporus TaxID=1908 RepID=UPI0019A1337F|nr:hypothetical protein GCM10010264_16600 [Streptomyces globisporus]
MGMDLTLFMVDWERLGAVPVEDRIGLLEDMAWPWGPEEPYDLGRGRADGRLRPPGPEPAWCAEYSFLTTNGAHMPHVRAGSAWAGMRSLVDASVREPMDTFLDGLVRDAGPAFAGGEGFFPPAADPWHRHVLLACPPEVLSGKARAWERVEPRLEELREPFAAECEGWAGRPESFEAFTALVREWGAVTTTAAGRGWGLVGLP